MYILRKQFKEAHSKMMGNGSCRLERSLKMHYIILAFNATMSTLSTLLYSILMIHTSSSMALSVIWFHCGIGPYSCGMFASSCSYINMCLNSELSPLRNELLVTCIPRPSSCKNVLCRSFSSGTCKHDPTVIYDNMMKRYLLVDFCKENKHQFDSVHDVLDEENVNI